MRAFVLIIFLESAICNTTLDFEKIFSSPKGISNLTSTPSAVTTLYLPKWDDLDTRPLPQWYDAAKIGIFIHWGIYSVAGESEWLWRKMVDDAVVRSSIREKYGPKFIYEYFAPLFKAQTFNPNKWAKLFAKSGAKYVVLTAKHHDGFALFPSNRPFWNSVTVGPKKDIVQVLSKAVRKHNMKFGIYYSLYEWYHTLFTNDRDGGYNTTTYTDSIVWPDITSLVKKYKPSVLWSDGESDASDSYWKSPELLAWLYNESPVKGEIVVNDRWGKDTNCKHGDFYNCEDRFNPRDYAAIRHKWENALSLDRYSWGYRKDMNIELDVLSDHELLEEVVSTVSCAGNVLINIGPTKRGTIPSIFRMRLLRLGKWLKINGEAIYGSSPWYYHRDTFNADTWYTCTKKEYHPLNPINTPEQTDTIEAIYAIFLKWPVDDKLRLTDLVSFIKNGNRHVVQMIQPKGYELIEYVILNDTMVFDLPRHYNNKSSGVLKISSNDEHIK